MKNEIEEIFGCRSKWRIIKFFLLNEKAVMTANEINMKNKLGLRESLSALNQLTRARFLLVKITGRQKTYYLNLRFPFYQEMKNLVIRSNTYPQCESLRKIENMGDIKLAIISGAFINNLKSKTDLLIVGDLISKAKFKHLLESLEAELGREINYSLMNFQEFKYRVNMFDKFVLEIIEEPHEIVVNKIPNLIKELEDIKKSKF